MKKKNKVIEVRSMPTLLEKRNTIFEAMENLLKTVNTETRSLNEEEIAKFNEYKQEIASIDTTLEAEVEARKLQQKNEVKPAVNVIVDSKAEEKRAMEEAETKFLDYIKGIDVRALDVAGNGGIIPTLISDRIIMKVRELSPLYARCTVFNVGGDLVFPKYDYTGIVTAYVADLTALTAQNANFTTVKLQNFIAGALVIISRSLMNRTDFDLVTFIVNAMAMSIANFIENQLLNGTGTGQATGIFQDASVTSVTAGSATAIAMDDIISLTMAVPQQFQADSIFIMPKSVLTGLMKLKDTTGNYLMQRDVTQEFPWTLMGKPAYISENLTQTPATGVKVIAYGDMSGLYCKLAQNVEIQVLNELYANQHGVGVVGYIELDSKVVESQKIAILKMA